MRCEPCQGSGWDFDEMLGMSIPCTECGGSGVVSCCEGASRFGQLYDSKNAKINSHTPLRTIGMQPRKGGNALEGKSGKRPKG